MQSGDICPVFCGINQTGAGVSLALDILSEIAPAADKREYRVKRDAEGTENCNVSAPATAVVFKTITDPFVGKAFIF